MMSISNYIELQSEEDHMNDAYEKELKDWNLQTTYTRNHNIQQPLDLCNNPLQKNKYNGWIAGLGHLMQLKTSYFIAQTNQETF